MNQQDRNETKTNTNNTNNTNTNGSSKSNTKRIDRFGFILSDDDNKGLDNNNNNNNNKNHNHQSSAAPTEEELKRASKREKKWEMMIQSWDATLVKRPKLVLSRLRKGLPESIRGNVWALLAEVKKSEHTGLYQKYVNQSAAAAATWCLPVNNNSSSRKNGDNGLDDGSSSNITNNNNSSSSSSSSHSNSNPNNKISSEQQKEQQNAANHNNNNDNNNSNSNQHSKYMQNMQEVIERDIPRTYPRHSLFFEDEVGDDRSSSILQQHKPKDIHKELLSGVGGQASLRRVLNAYCCYDNELGYCQGMNFIAAMFLTLTSEEETFWLLVATMKEKPCKMRGLFCEGMSDTHMVLYTAEKLIQQFLPKLSKHFEKENIHITMYATQWLLTQYTSSFPFDLVFRVWDAYLIEGWKITYRVMLAILTKFQPMMLKMAFEEILNFFRDLPSKVDSSNIMNIAMKIPLRRKHIVKYEQAWQAQQQNQ